MTGRSPWTLALFLPYLGQAAEICFRGMRLYSPYKGPDVCLWCDHGTFMPEEVHSQRRCYPCTTIQNPQLEKLVSPCNSTHDTGIHCIDGYYRTQPSYPEDRGHCQPCTKCPFPKRPCLSHNDTVCCPGDDYDVYINKNGHPICLRECGVGHFLDVDENKCLSCPQNTYMDERKHINIHCKNCEIPKSKTEKIVRLCNATHPSVIDCVDGYSRQFSDTKQPGHGECVKFCGRGHYLNPTTDTCQICPENTYMDEDEHSYAYKCRPCAIPNSGNEKIIQPCNGTHPTMIGCVEGFYRQLSHDMATNICAPCRNCSENTDGNVYEGRACGELSNSVCCPQPNMAVIETPDGPVCVFLPSKFAGSATCGEGEFLHTSANSHSLICLPCPQGTYMDKVQHTSTSCKSCIEVPNIMYCDDSNGIIAHERDREDGPEVNALVGLLIMQIILLAIIIVVTTLMCWWKKHKAKRRKVDDDSEKVPLVSSKESEKSGPKDPTETKDLDSGGTIIETRYKEFIPVTEFSSGHLSIQYCDDFTVDLIKLQAKLTTLITVRYSSDHRPKLIRSTKIPYPYSEDRYRNEPHRGSGWVQGVKIYSNIPCPCEACRACGMSNKDKKWGEVVICTATRVVYDITEAKNCQCCFFYENADTGILLCPSLSGAVKVLSDVDRDWCYMTFVTHNLELVQELQDHFTKYHRLRRDVQHKYGVVIDNTSYKELPGKLPPLYNRFRQSMNLLKREMEEIHRNADVYNVESSHSVVSNYGQRLQDSSSSFGVLLNLTNRGNDSKCQRLLNMLSTLSKNFSDSLEETTSLKRQLQQTNVQDEGLVLDKYRELCRKEDRLHRFLQLLRLNLKTLKGVTSITENAEYPPRYDSEHLLTVIVSHPDGGSQQVSLGEVTDTSSLWYDHHSMYRYTNKTRQGCEGACVFILGRKGLSDHSHSGIVDGEGESGAWSDIIPYIVNLSAIPEKN